MAANIATNITTGNLNVLANGAALNPLHDALG